MHFNNIVGQSLRKGPANPSQNTRQLDMRHLHFGVQRQQISFIGSHPNSKYLFKYSPEPARPQELLLRMSHYFIIDPFTHL